MPEFWEFPTVSMGLGPIMAIYQARFNRYLTDRGIVRAIGKLLASGVPVTGQFYVLNHWR